MIESRQECGMARNVHKFICKLKQRVLRAVRDGYYLLVIHIQYIAHYFRLISCINYSLSFFLFFFLFRFFGTFVSRVILSKMFVL